MKPFDYSSFVNNMAHGRPASRQGRFVYHSDHPQNGTADELPSQSVFSFHGSDG